MVHFSDFDTRNYPTVDVRTGYAQWVATYEQTVEDAMDLAVLDRLTTPAWPEVGRAADLGCGTGRTGAWLRARATDGLVLDGVDLTPEMLAAARERGAHDSLTEGDVAATGLAEGGYDLVVSSLIDEHLADLGPYYREAWRLARPGGRCVLVGLHPYFIMAAGMPTHFTGEGGADIAITTHVHLVSDHLTAGLAAGWTLVEMAEAVVDDAWIALKPKWEKYRSHPVSAAYVWEKRA
ncbi:class I SAM-dependent methyltransferase [Streptomyces sp. BE20]|uniref:class I SAM-dependent DNA methyltransferase n=1 Tax=Streptomyces sp. BE20 TaxID=3002525 RepID=UPI002E79CCB2|nr:class I SAM-dependent methyltransferase [Streptomyces sp. BE20]MEE1829202.1 class I SAM-dependent methyltransferase [Streptomyces sp. BE20]